MFYSNDNGKENCRVFFCRYIFLFNEAAEEEEPARIYSLTYQKAIDTMRTLSERGPKKCFAIENICHYTNAVLSENNGHLSTWLIARLIKYLIYHAKIEHDGRLKVKADLDRKIDEECPTIRNTGSSKSAVTKLHDCMLSGKVNRRLYMDSIPFDEPKLYIVLSGLHNPDLPVELLSIKLPLTCILEIKLSKELIKRNGTMDPKIYEDLLNAVPSKYTDVPLILSAILPQVEHNLATSSDGRLPNTSTTAERSLVFNMQDKLKLLDLEHELTDEYVDGPTVSSSRSLSDLKVILFEDGLSTIMCHFIDQRPSSRIMTCVTAVKRMGRSHGSGIKRTRSLPNFTSLPIGTSSSRCSKSETEIDYCKPAAAFTEYPLSFALTDARRDIASGISVQECLQEKKLREERVSKNTKTSSYSRVFLQVARECFQSFDRFAGRYFEPTDSMLLYFSNNNAVDNGARRKFCEYIAEEEENRIKRERETRQSRRMGLTGRFMKKSIDAEDDAIIFDDECFVLPDSLKASHLKKTLGRKGQKKIFETAESEEDGSEARRGKENDKTETKRDAKIDDVDTSFLPAEKKFYRPNVSRRGGPYDFRLTLRNRDLRIAVALAQCTLRLSNGVSRQTLENSSNSHWQNLTFDFRALWPLGLLIEPTVEDGTKNPFCIRQSYVLKRSERAGAAREICRNFLRNGTVLKYLDDNTVVIFRLNGVIVTCTDFDKPQSRDESIREMVQKVYKNSAKFRIKKGNSRQSVAASGKVIDSTETRSNKSIRNEDDSLIIGTFGAGEALRYLVNYDGRYHKVLNDQLVSERDRLLVRTTSDYEVNEVFTRRADGTDTLVCSNEELIVIFSGIRSCRTSDAKRNQTVSIADGFVTILLTLRSAVSCTLSMPDNLRVSISRRGHYEVSIGDKVNLKVIKVAFRKFVGADSRTIVTTGGGGRGRVKSVRYHALLSKQRSPIYIEVDSNVLEHDDERRRGENEDASLDPRIHCKHERYCETLKFPARSQYRIFAMNRDLTACEYPHRSVRREQKVAAVFGDEMSMIQYPISRRPELHRLITFVPTRVTSDKRTDYDRIELSRSTYSFPYNWLFPFGKKVVAERTRNEVLAKRNEQSLHKLLRVRVFFGIKGAKRSVLIDMQRAMGRYWISVLRDSDKCRLFYATGSRSRPYEVENNYESSQDGLRELAVGVKESIDVETYVRSLQGKLIKVSTKASRQSSRLAELLRQRRSMKEEYEWYKQCMRKRIIVPYFRNIADSRYFLMKNHVDGATSKRSYLRVVAEKRRSR
ncbi:hypothetical protein PUN28_001336 [Cardiocondyla obscurior]|uniref:Uncharacterized protein n=1 Tax=Cardiocondyla obscurior TaxID=286306 RepID=A0AAW2H565_9HYME